MNDNVDKQKVLKYAQLIFKKKVLEKRHMQGALSTEDLEAIEKIPRELGMTSEAILELASKSLIPDNEC